jgi:hypothetical protein
MAAACALLLWSPARAEGPEVTAEQVTALLASLHADYGLYIGSVRIGGSRLRPASIYAGLVRRGGRDPQDPRDGPQMGLGATNDLIIYTDTFESWRTTAWRRLLADHEYFHARHMAHGFPIPVVGFGDAQADADYYEALAWGYVLERAAGGAYGDLSPKERAEAAAQYENHFGRFQRFVLRRQPSAWAHYGRFLPPPDTIASLTTPVASAPTAEPAPAAASGTW